MRSRGRVWRDRREAGEQLGAAVQEQLRDIGDVLVLGLPRGGVAVAAPVAAAVGGELDVLVVRKAGVPWQPELALGAVTASGHRVVNREVARRIRLAPGEVETIFRDAQEAARERERRLRGERPPPRLAGRTVVLVDDGIATGATMRAAAELLATAEPPPSSVLVAVPVGPRSTVDQLANVVDAVVVLEMPATFNAVGEWYDDFTQVEDADVRALLAP
ncbi:phosphoribosyltransferase [Jiangella rhizosphaerae]|uniref:Phosphoribosyltransferase n=1 Tax=Jiangella rhizosphaerae TaxID=2293569 RepID=A0A418KQH5_9ACTN|nr:phosphoribosyltransferase family protein [Jiangella rhizosphaerae]RIQ22539.1 phosphoribosyltransferase [Jiangella rhizosphaerae]